MISFIVEGDFACFTRPELNVERVSYDVMTPSAARGIARSVYWKPCLQYRIHKIDVLNPIQHMQVRRNEVKSRAKRVSKKAMAGKAVSPYGIDVVSDRTQRSAIILRDVAYRVTFDFDLVGYGTNAAKHHAIFNRRLDKGQVFRRPYLGCREFSCEVYPDDISREPVSTDRPLGRLLLDLQFDDQGDDTYQVTPVYFNAQLDSVTLHLPQDKYNKVNA